MQTIVVPNEREVIECLATKLDLCSREALSNSAGVFRIGVSGGSVVNYLSAAIPLIKTDLTKWKIFFCDERYVPESDADSTFGAYKALLLPKVALNEQQFFKINTVFNLDECAKDYERQIMEEFELRKGQVPAFDVLLLGMGPDGHTCSLFTTHKLLQEREKLIAPIEDSPKPPSARVTMTLPLINNANCCIFAMCGASKADMVKRVFVDKDNTLPAALVRPINGSLLCIFDAEAGKFIE